MTTESAARSSLKAMLEEIEVVGAVGIAEEADFLKFDGPSCTAFIPLSLPSEDEAYICSSVTVFQDRLAQIQRTYCLTECVMAEREHPSGG